MPPVELKVKLMSVLHRKALSQTDLRCSALNGFSYLPDENDGTQHHSQISREKAPEHGKDGEKIARNQKGHESCGARLSDQACSGRRREIEKEDEQQLNGDNRKEIGIQTHSPEDDEGDEALVEIEDDC